MCRGKVLLRFCNNHKQSLCVCCRWFNLYSSIPVGRILHLDWRGCRFESCLLYNRCRRKELLRILIGGSRVRLPSGLLCITANGPVAQWVEQHVLFSVCYPVNYSKKFKKTKYVKKIADKTGKTKVNGNGLLVEQLKGIFVGQK